MSYIVLSLFYSLTGGPGLIKGIYFHKENDIKVVNIGSINSETSI
jgi:hypothetical protein